MLQVLQGGEYVSVNNPNGTSWQVPPVECADRRCPKSAPSIIRERHRRVSGQMLLRVEVIYCQKINHHNSSSSTTQIK